MKKNDNKNEERINTQLNQSIEALANILVFIIEENSSVNRSTVNYKDNKNSVYDKRTKKN